MRVVALRVPDFPLQALRRSIPDLAEAPLAIAAGPLPRDKVICVSAEAAGLGARAGMTVAQARQVAPAIMVRVIPEEAAAAADEALADAAGGFSPRLRRHAPGEVLLDVDGLVPRDGGREFTSRERGGHGGSRAPGGGGEWRGTPREESLAHELLRACRHVGLEASVGIASSAGVARVAARSGDLTVVVSGGEREFMAPLPLALLHAVLEPAPEVIAMLARWGLATAGELARLPRREVALRLGPEGTTLHRLACGDEAAAFVPDPLREVLREGVEVDYPVGALEPFLFLTSGLLARLERRLELRGEGFSEVLLELHLEGGGHREHRITLVAPTREVPAVLALVRLQLEANPPGAPTEGVVVLVTPGRVRLTQGSLFGAPVPASGKLSTALARLAALVGPDRVGAPGVPDTHRPAAWTLTPFVLAEDRAQGAGRRAQGTGHRKATTARKWGGGGAAPCALRPDPGLAGVPAAAPGAGGGGGRPARRGAGGRDGWTGRGVGGPVPVRRRLVG
jgi:nucleotidyltransferase/DNA polymerase involved in DNA repair